MDFSGGRSLSARKRPLCLALCVLVLSSGSLEAALPGSGSAQEARRLEGGAFAGLWQSTWRSAGVGPTQNAPDTRSSQETATETARHSTGSSAGVEPTQNAPDTRSIQEAATEMAQYSTGSSAGVGPQPATSAVGPRNPSAEGFRSRQRFLQAARRRAATGDGLAAGLLQNAATAQVPVQQVTIGRPTGVTWAGWGTALAWFANFAGGLPRWQREYILDALFDPVTGLGLNIVRYIMPGGLNPKYSPLLAKLPFQAVPGFRQSRAGPYNWTADFNQRIMLNGALRRGAVAEAQAYSPPWWQTISGDVAGNVRGRPNLAPGNYSAFVEYMADVLAHFKTAWGINFVGFNPFNEPLAGWWKTGNNQEGCGFPLADLALIYAMTRKALDRRGMGDLLLVGIDEWLGRTRSTLSVQPGIWPLIQRVALHGYRSPTWVEARTAAEDQLDKLQLLSQDSRARRKDLWVAEWGPWRPKPGEPSDFDLALIQTRSVIEFINVGGASAFLHWQAVLPYDSYSPTPFGQNCGLIRLIFNYSAPFRPVITKQYYGQKQLTAAIKPGSRILTVPQEFMRNVVMAYNAASQQLGIVMLNDGDQLLQLHFPLAKGLSITSTDPSGLHGEVYRTSLADSFRSIYKGVFAKTWSSYPGIKVRPREVLSLIVSGVVLQG